jgi:hypothetical protein
MQFSHFCLSGNNLAFQTESNIGGYTSVSSDVWIWYFCNCALPRLLHSSAGKISTNGDTSEVNQVVDLKER